MFLKRALWALSSMILVGCGGKSAEIQRPAPDSLTVPKIPAPEAPSQYKYEASSEGFPAGNSFAVWINGRGSYGPGRRGFNILVSDPKDPFSTSWANFDTWGQQIGLGGNAWQKLTAYIDSIPDKAIVIVGVADEAGINQGISGGCFDSSSPGTPKCCQKLDTAYVEAGLKKLEALGSKQIRNYCYRNSWSMIAVKGEGAKDESLKVTGSADVGYIIPK